MESISAELASIVNTLEYVEQKLELEFSNLQTEDGKRLEVNPVRVAQRLKRARAALPQLLADWERVLAAKQEMMSVAQSVMMATRDTLAQCCAVVAEGSGGSTANTSATTAGAALQQTARQWQRGVREYLAATDQAEAWQGVELPPAREEASAAPEETGSLDWVRACVAWEAECVPATVDAKEHAGGEENRDRQSLDAQAAREEAQRAAIRAEWVPVSKAAFQRLPQTYRRRIASLETLNELYAHLYCEMRLRGDSVLSDAQMMLLTGESSTDKVEVLRALALVRRVRDGWVLAGASDANRALRDNPSHRPRAAPPKTSSPPRPRSKPLNPLDAFSIHG